MPAVVAVAVAAKEEERHQTAQSWPGMLVAAAAAATAVAVAKSWRNSRQRRSAAAATASAVAAVGSEVAAGSAVAAVETVATGTVAAAGTAVVAVVAVVAAAETVVAAREAVAGIAVWIATIQSLPGIPGARCSSWVVAAPVVVGLKIVQNRPERERPEAAAAGGGDFLLHLQTRPTKQYCWARAKEWPYYDCSRILQTSQLLVRLWEAVVPLSAGAGAVVHLLLLECVRPLLLLLLQLLRLLHHFHLLHRTTTCPCICDGSNFLNVVDHCYLWVP